MAPDLDPKSTPAQVMVVEDTVVLRSTVAEALRAAGLCVIEAANAGEAWSYLQSGAPVDLIFSDIRMPGAMDGIELAGKVSADYDHIVIVLTSGKAPPWSEAAHRFIRKPYRIRDVVKTISDILQNK